MLLIMFVLPIVYSLIFAAKTVRPVRWGASIVAGLVLAIVSLAVHGSRGGLPPADVYGWPKEYVSIRDGGIRFQVSYFFVDLLFYTIFAASIDALRESLIKNEEDHS